MSRPQGGFCFFRGTGAGKNEAQVAVAFGQRHQRLVELGGNLHRFDVRHGPRFGFAAHGF